jgi:hypothetical protein
MRTANFCSNCGEQLQAYRASVFSARSYCSRCAPRFRSSRLAMIVSLAGCLIIGYAFGRYNTPRQPFYLLGTPIDPITNNNGRRETNAQANSNKANANKSANSNSPPPESSTDVVVKLCGAPTKSGRPCRRKVVGGGYCWQHRDKYKPKKPANSAQ